MTHSRINQPTNSMTSQHVPTLVVNVLSKIIYIYYYNRPDRAEPPQGLQTRTLNPRPKPQTLDPRTQARYIYIYTYYNN